MRTGTYQGVCKFYGGPATDYGNQSEVVAITVALAKNKEAEHEALTNWLYKAAYPQRVEIAEQLLLRFNDTSGTKEVLRLLGENAYSKKTHWDPSAVRYAWKHGGKEGERVMLDLIESQTRQSMVDHLIEDIGWSADHLALLEELLACKKTVFKDEDSWVRTPRVCDITAAYLRGYPWDVTIKFPKLGSDEERDKAVEEVTATLRSDPNSLRIPAVAYTEDRTLGDERKVTSEPK